MTTIYPHPPPDYGLVFTRILPLSARGPSLYVRILTYKDGPRAEIIKLFLMGVDP